jgi:hypothetical protein
LVARPISIFDVEFCGSGPKHKLKHAFINLNPSESSYIYNIPEQRSYLLKRTIHLGEIFLLQEREQSRKCERKGRKHKIKGKLELIA